MNTSLITRFIFLLIIIVSPPLAYANKHYPYSPFNRKADIPVENRSHSNVYFVMNEIVVGHSNEGEKSLLSYKLLLETCKPKKMCDLYVWDIRDNPKLSSVHFSRFMNTDDGDSDEYIFTGSVGGGGASYFYPVMDTTMPYMVIYDEEFNPK